MGRNTTAKATANKLGRKGRQLWGQWEKRFLPLSGLTAENRNKVELEGGPCASGARSTQRVCAVFEDQGEKAQGVSAL